jgi:Flp pilus assembly pilin Flp
MTRVRHFLRDEAGVEIIEWVIVTVILTLAVYAILQAVGPELIKSVRAAGDFVRSLLRGR